VPDMPAWFARPVFSLQQEWTASEMPASIIALVRCDLFAEELGISLCTRITFRVAEQRIRLRANGAFKK